jgi:hypothetical protein
MMAATLRLSPRSTVVAETVNVAVPSDGKTVMVWGDPVALPPFESVTVTHTEYVPGALGVQESAVALALAQPGGRPCQTTLNEAVPTTGFTERFAPTPRSRELFDTVSVPAKGAAETSMAVPADVLATPLPSVTVTETVYVPLWAGMQDREGPSTEGQPDGSPLQT